MALKDMTKKSWWTGRNDIYEDKEAVASAKQELTNIGDTGLSTVKSDIEVAVGRLNKVKGFNQYVGTIPSGFFDETIDVGKDAINVLIEQIDSKVAAIEEYNKGSFGDHVIGTIGMFAAKTGEGFLSVFEDLGDGAASLLGWGLSKAGATGAAKSLETFVNKEWSHDAFNKFYNSDIAKQSAFTEDSGIAKGAHLIGATGGYLVMTGATSSLVGGRLASKSKSLGQFVSKLGANGGKVTKAATNFVGNTVINSSATTLSGSLVGLIAGTGSGTEAGIRGGKTIDKAFTEDGLVQGGKEALIAFGLGKLGEGLAKRSANKKANEQFKKSPQEGKPGTELEEAPGEKTRTEKTPNTEEKLETKHKQKKQELGEANKKRNELIRQGATEEEIEAAQKKLDKAHQEVADSANELREFRKNNSNINNNKTPDVNEVKPKSSTSSTSKPKGSTELTTKPKGSTELTTKPKGSLIETNKTTPKKVSKTKTGSVTPPEGYSDPITKKSADVVKKLMKKNSSSSVKATKGATGTKSTALIVSDGKVPSTTVNTKLSTSLLNGTKGSTIINGSKTLTTKLINAGKTVVKNPGSTLKTVAGSVVKAAPAVESIPGITAAAINSSTNMNPAVQNSVSIPSVPEITAEALNKVPNQTDTTTTTDPTTPDTTSDTTSDTSGGYSDRDSTGGYSNGGGGSQKRKVDPVEKIKDETPKKEEDTVKPIVDPTEPTDPTDVQTDPVEPVEPTTPEQEPITPEVTPQPDEKPSERPVEQPTSYYQGGGTPESSPQQTTNNNNNNKPNTTPVTPTEDDGALDDMEESFEDVINNSSVNVVKTQKPIVTSSKGSGSAVIPIAAGLSAAAAAGIGAKAYMDRKNNNDNGEDDEIEEWNDQDTVDIDYDDQTEEQQYLDDEVDNSFQEEKYGARTSEELADLQ